MTRDPRNQRSLPQTPAEHIIKRRLSIGLDLLILNQVPDMR